MKKATFILIGLVYVASVVLISIFGIKAMVYDENIPVTEVVCLNESDSKKNIEVEYDEDGNKVIYLPFIGPGDEATLAGTKLQLEWQVLPNNASTKDVRFEYNKESTRYKFIKQDGKEVGLILFEGKGITTVKIFSTDGSEKNVTVTIVVY